MSHEGREDRHVEGAVYHLLDGVGVPQPVTRPNRVVQHVGQHRPPIGPTVGVGLPGVVTAQGGLRDVSPQGAPAGQEVDPVDGRLRVGHGEHVHGPDGLRAVPLDVPQTVLVNRPGLLRRIHRGVSPDHIRVHRPEAEPPVFGDVRPDHHLPEAGDVELYPGHQAPEPGDAKLALDADRLRALVSDFGLMVIEHGELSAPGLEDVGRQGHGTPGLPPDAPEVALEVALEVRPPDAIQQPPPPPGLFPPGAGHLIGRGRGRVAEGITRVHRRASVEAEGAAGGRPGERSLTPEDVRL